VDIPYFLNAADAIPQEVICDYEFDISLLQRAIYLADIFEPKEQRPLARLAEEVRFRAS